MFINVVKKIFLLHTAYLICYQIIGSQLNAP